ncbi:MAG: hemolysin III family protein [Bdellovibrionaceae bacterium]|nr:hemolysin III family protein [Bdellovibrio sp.]
MYKGERFNSITHLLGVVLACIGVSLLIANSINKGDVYKITAFTIYGIILIGLYSVSTIYHSIQGPWKNFFRQMDYLSIYVMIAGTYTPFTLITLRGVWGWSLFAVIWTLAILGIIQEIILGKKTRRYSLIIYLLMGWLITIALKPLIASIAPAGIWWLVAGGLSYTIGVIFFVFDEKVRHFHGVWHLFVMGGSLFQFICLFFYVA